MTCRVGLSSDQGPRDYNEDNGVAIRALGAGREVVLLGVCDGMGGDANGGRAAMEVSTALSGFLSYLPPRVYQESTSEFVKQEVAAAVLKWHQSTLRHLEDIEEVEHLKGLTTTLVAALMWNDSLVVWWLGDSRIYRFRDGQLERLTEDHSKVFETLSLPEEEALEHPERNKVSRFLRPGTASEPEMRFYDWQDGDVVFAVSDGVSGSCRSWELESFIAYWLATDITANTLCEHILTYVKKNMQDNATIAIGIRGTPKPFVASMATLEVPVFVKYGLKENLVNALKDYPTSSHEWLSRKRPAWRDTSPLATTEMPMETRIVGGGPRDDKCSDSESICLVCGQEVRSTTDPCPKHGTERLWKGFYFEVVSPAGKITYYPLRSDRSLVIGRPEWADTDIVLAGDEMVSSAHVVFNVDEAGDIRLHDMRSDNGVWLRVRDVCLPSKDWLQGDVSIIVGRHRVTLRTTLLPVGEPSYQQKIMLIPPPRVSSAAAESVLETSADSMDRPIAAKPTPLGDEPPTAHGSGNGENEGQSSGNSLLHRLLNAAARLVYSKEPND